jgi:putative membrane protein
MHLSANLLYSFLPDSGVNDVAENIPGNRPYEGLEEELILRDVLARDRTMLANERTLLAYARTSLGMVAAGVTFIQFFQLPWIEVVGWSLIPSAVVIFGLGVRRYLRVRQDLFDVK